MTTEDIIQGKAGFQKAALMDYGSLYGMGSYFGEDYTAQYLVELAQEVMSSLAQKAHHKPIKQLSEPDQFSVQREMQKLLKGIQLNQETVIVPDVLSQAMMTFRSKIANDLLTDRFEKGWGKAASLNQNEAEKTADFLIYSVLTTVANRPDKDFSWTNNWPPEPLVGNAPTTETFTWTWASLTLLFFAIGVVVVIFRLYIDHSFAEGTSEAILNSFAKLTPSQLALSKYFLVSLYSF